MSSLLIVMMAEPLLSYRQFAGIIGSTEAIFCSGNAELSLLLTTSSAGLLIGFAKGWISRFCIFLICGGGFTFLTMIWLSVALVVNLSLTGGDESVPPRALASRIRGVFLACIASTRGLRKSDLFLVATLGAVVAMESLLLSRGFSKRVGSG